MRSLGSAEMERFLQAHTQEMRGCIPLGVWFDFVRSALLLAVVLGWVARCFDSCVLLGLLCFLRVTNHHTTVNKHVSGGC